MKKIRTTHFALLLAGLLAAGGQQAHAQVQLAFLPESKVTIEGTASAVHEEWECETSTLNGTVSTEAGALQNVSGVKLTIPLEAFDCGNPIMGGRMRKEMKASDHPNVTYTLKTAEVVPGDDGNSFQLHTTGDVTIAGVTKTVEMLAEGEQLEGGKLRFSGHTPLLMTDFGVEPPRMLNIRTGDEVNIVFDVVLAASAP